MSPIIYDDASKAHTNGHSAPPRLFSVHNPPSLKAFDKLCSRKADQSEYPLASSIVSNIPLYDLSTRSLSDSRLIEGLQNEWYHVLSSGPGVLVLQNFFQDQRLVQRVNTVFDRIIGDEQQTAKGDHFASAGKNSRIWNAFQKHAETDPASFVSYYSNTWLSLVSEAWLGPAYQVTTQVNVVRPGGQPQVAHRDYHLGFQTATSCAQFPRSMQIASQLLTLQGAVAHSDMPLESGPTRFLPFSQQFEEGFMAYRLPEFIEYFNQHWISVPLKTGDAVFFNPALFHAAGENVTTDVHRSANLLQISSAFGRPMESVNNLKIISKCWDSLTARYKSEGFSSGVEACVKAVASGYPFPMNLDQRPPAPGGMAPESEADVVIRGLHEHWTTAEIVDALTQLGSDSGA